jgi:hypothetical protein
MATSDGRSLVDDNETKVVLRDRLHRCLYVVDEFKGNPGGAIDHAALLASEHTNLQIGHLVNSEIQQLYFGHLVRVCDTVQGN